jgi:hypothetical protein
MAEPTYNSLSLGRSVRVDPKVNERATQVSHVFGVNGNFILDGGSNGYSFEVSGFLPGDDDADLAAQYTAWEKLVDNVEREFVDTMGRTFSNTRLVQFRKAGRTVNRPNSRLLPYFAVFEANALPDPPSGDEVAE